MRTRLRQLALDHQRKLVSKIVVRRGGEDAKNRPARSVRR